MLSYIFVVISRILLTNAMFIIWFGVNFMPKSLLTKIWNLVTYFLPKFTYIKLFDESEALVQ